MNEKTQHEKQDLAALTTMRRPPPQPLPVHRLLTDLRLHMLPPSHAHSWHSSLSSASSTLGCSCADHQRLTTNTSVDCTMWNPVFKQCCPAHCVGTLPLRPRQSHVGIYTETPHSKHESKQPVLRLRVSRECCRCNCVLFVFK
jgi:hypothetical protein